jgi:hypothetical protein
MLTSYFNITTIAEWSATLAAILLLNKKTGVWRLFIPYLLLTLAAERLGWYVIHVLKLETNVVVFSVRMIISNVFLLWLLTHAKPLANIKKWLYVVICVYLPFSIINLFVQGIDKYSSNSEVLGDALLATISCYLLYQLLNAEEYIDLFRYEYFWLASGLLFSSLGNMVMYIFLTDLQAYKQKTHIPIFGYINSTVNIILYGSLIIAFICRNRITQHKREIAIN